MASSSKAEGRIDKILCSKVRVKSKSLVALAGPNELSELSARPRRVKLEAIDA